MILQIWQGGYIHIKQRELMAGDEVSGNNVMEGDANNRSDVYTSCTDNVGKNTNGHIHWCLLDTIACSSTCTVRSRTGLVDQRVTH